MRKNILLAAMALVVILAAGNVDAQNRVFWSAPGERVDYTGAVDDWTGSMAQRQLESTRSMITGPIRDLRRHWAANSGYPDSYYGSGVGPSAPYGIGDRYDRGYGYGSECYGGRGCGPYMMGRRYDWRDARYTYRGRYGSRSSNRSSWPVVAAVVGSTIVSEVRADRRHNEVMGELEADNQVRDREPVRRSEARGYYGSAQARPSRPEQFRVRNGTGADFCIKGKTLSPRAGDSILVDSPDNLEIAAPPGKSICTVTAEFIGDDTILVTCKEGR